MSAFLQRADEMKQHLEGIAALSGIPVIVDRQKDISSDFKKSIAKKKGVVIIIFWSGFTPAEEGSKDTPLVSEYTVTVWSKPILRRGQVTADEIVQNVFSALNGWIPEEFCPETMFGGPGRLIPNPSFLIYEVKFKAIINLP